MPSVVACTNTKPRSTTELANESLTVELSIVSIVPMYAALSECSPLSRAEFVVERLRKDDVLAGGFGAGPLLILCDRGLDDAGTDDVELDVTFSAPSVADALSTETGPAIGATDLLFAAILLSVASVSSAELSTALVLSVVVPTPDSVVLSHTEVGSNCPIKRLLSSDLVSEAGFGETLPILCDTGKSLADADILAI